MRSGQTAPNRSRPDNSMRTLVVAGDAAAREWRWWRRRPPAGHTRFARGVWWAGHLQLAIAAALLIVCLPAFVVGLTVPPTAEAALGGAAPFFSRVGQVWIALLGLAMAGPSVLSGLMLRVSSDWAVYSDPPVGAPPARRILGLVVTVAGIAMGAVALTVLAVYVLLHVVGLVESR